MPFKSFTLFGFLKDSEKLEGAFANPSVLFLTDGALTELMVLVLGLGSCLRGGFWVRRICLIYLQRLGLV
jgi:hypothetical protein